MFNSLYIARLDIIYIFHDKNKKSFIYFSMAKRANFYLFHGQTKVQYKEVSLHTHRVLQQHLHILHAAVTETLRNI